MKDLRNLQRAGLPRTGGRWNSAAPMALPRSEVTGAASGGRIFIFGGVHKGYTVDRVEAYDPRADRWQDMRPLPVPLDHTFAVSVDQAIYIFGGSLSATVEVSGETLDEMMKTTNWDFSPRSAMWRYLPAEDRFERLANMPLNRLCHSAVVIGRRIHVVGGQGPNPGVMMRYDVDTGVWDFLPGMPTFREHLAIGEIGGRIFAAGGRWPDPTDPASSFVFGVQNTGATEVYDPGTREWSPRAALPTPRGAGCGAVLDGRLWVAGGEVLDSADRLTNAEVEVYDPATDSWMVAPDLPTPRHGLALVAEGGRLYAIGGGPLAAFSGTGATEVFTPD